MRNAGQGGVGGPETKRPKHIDWEIYSSMVDGEVNKKSGRVVINPPTIDNGSVVACAMASPAGLSNL